MTTGRRAAAVGGAAPGPGAVQAGGAAAPGHDAAQAGEATAPGHDAAQAGEATAPGHDAAQAGGAAAPGPGAVQAGGAAAPGHDAAQAGGAAAPGPGAAQAGGAVAPGPGAVEAGGAAAPGPGDVQAGGAVRSVVITGASRGLGAALAEALAGPGVALHLLGRDGAALEAVAGRCRARGAAVFCAAVEVTDAAAMAAQLGAWDAARPVGLAIANAGTSGGTGLDGAPEGHAAALRQVRVNLEGAMNLVEPLLPAMLARGAGQLLLVGSVMGFRGLPDVPAYAASKAGVWAYGEALRAAHGAAGLRVTVAAPGFFASAMSARVRGARAGGEVTAAAMAARLLRAVARGRGRVVSPWWLGAGLRVLALLPPRLGDRWARLVRFRVSPGG